MRPGDGAHGMVDEERVHVRRSRDEQLGARQRELAAGLRELDVEADERRGATAGELEDHQLLALKEAGVGLRREQVRLAVDTGERAVGVDAGSRVGGALRRPFREADYHRRLRVGRRCRDARQLVRVRRESELVEVAIGVAAEIQLGKDGDRNLRMRPDRIDCPCHVPVDVSDPAGELREQRLMVVPPSFVVRLWSGHTARS